MGSRLARVGLVAIGGLLLVPGILWVAGSGGRLNDDDALTALRPLKRISTKGATDPALIEANIKIPDTPQWTKIRKAWGEPEFAVGLVEGTSELSVCLPKMALRFELIDSKGRTVPLSPGHAPYGYSALCESSNLLFRAGPGDELTLKVTRTGSGSEPTGDLIVVSTWVYTKDKLVGISMNRGIESLVKWLGILGVLVLIFSGRVFLLDRRRQRQVA